MKHIIISNEPLVWEFCNLVDLDFLMIDLETLGKADRQFSKSTWISSHSMNDIVQAKAKLKSTRIIVRINPIHQGSEDEINQVIENGADLIMLPYFQTIDEVTTCYEIINRRVGLVLLFETIESLSYTNQIFERFEIEFAHVGLNDLSLDLKYPFLFQVLSTPLVEFFFQQANKNAIPAGVGGIGYNDLSTISPRLIYSEHRRLNSNYVILSRDFLKGLTMNEEVVTILAERFSELTKIEQEVDQLSCYDLMGLHQDFLSKVKEVSNG